MVKRLKKPPDQSSQAPDDAFPASIGFDGYVVALGASAGGLEALEQFFQNVPPDSGAAYVVIQHLSPDHKSLMASLLSRHTQMPVCVVENGMAITENRVYLIPPGCLLSLAGSQLQLMPKNPRGLSLPIDLFFSSLAEEFGPRAIAVILSGTGSDGTRGAIAINAAGGLLLAQEPETSKFDGMPRSVMATGVVDEVLPAQALGLRILGHIQQKPAPILPPDSSVPMGDSQAMDGILHILHQVGGVNFRDYKPATVMRRIDRRLHVRHAADYASYLHLLESDRSEVVTLRRDILIPVTSFFRDTAAFEDLAKTVIDAIVRERKENQPIRVWVAGTSTGEEAYSIAILFVEAFERARRWFEIKIFATDVEQQNIDAAGSGVFPESIASEVSPLRLERFFTQRGSHFMVKSEIRQSIVFARHNLLDDPPFTRMDLVTCSNILIYFQVPAQERVLRRLQYALLPGSHLFLGSSESLGELAADFSVVNARQKIFRILRPAALPIDLHRDKNVTPGEVKARHIRPRRGYGLSSEAAAIDSGQSLLLKAYAPPSMLLTAKREVIHTYGKARRYLHFPEGSVTLELSRLLHERLLPIALALLHKVTREGLAIRSEPLRITLTDGTEERLRLVARTAEEDDSAGVPRSEVQAEPYLLLSFEPEENAQVMGDIRPLDVDAETLERIEGLERELLATRESLQATVEELETSNEELQATNEELMASNEELQSSNEELQSMNEELYTVNAENQEKIQLMNRANADLDTMARAVSIATVFVDEHLGITRFTPEAVNFFPIQDADIGRSLNNFAHTLDFPDFGTALRDTVETGKMVEREVNTLDGANYLLRILPYQIHEGTIRGAVISLIDINALHNSRRLQDVIDSLIEHVAEIDSAGRITLINAAWREFARTNGDPDLLTCGLGVNYLEICARSDDPFARQAYLGLKNVLSGAAQTFYMEYPCHSPEEQRWFLMYASPTQLSGGGAIVSHINITSWVKDREQPGTT